MIFISVAHHPAAKGAAFVNAQGVELFNEYDESLIWSQNLHAVFGFDSVLVPTGKLKAKVAFINERATRNDLALEIHFNSAKNSHGIHVGRGCETLYCPCSVRGKLAAQIMQLHLATVMGPDRGVAEAWYQMNPAKGPDYFAAETKCPALIVEPEFVHRHDLIWDNRNLAVSMMSEAIMQIQEEVLV